MARRIRWQIMVMLSCGAMILFLLGHLALATTAQGAPDSGGIYREALVGQIRDLNPLRGTQQTLPEADLTALLFEGLTRIETSGTVAADLATEWEISPDQRTYTVTLRPDVSWHDGTPLTADDVVWTIQWVQSPTFQGDPNLHIAWQNVRITPLNEYQIRFDLPAAFAPFLNQLALPITPAHILRDADAVTQANWAERPIGTGSYQLTDRTETTVTLQRFPQYRLGSERIAPGLQPNLDQLTFHIFNSLEEAHAALRRGNVDALTYNVTEQESLPLPAEYGQIHAPLADYVLLSFNLRREPLAALEVRQGLAYAIEPQAIIDQALDGRALPLLTPILPSSWAANADLTPYVDNAQHQRALAAFSEVGWNLNSAGIMEQAGQPLSLTLITADAPERLEVAEQLASQLRDIGITINIEPLSIEQLNQRLQERRFDLAIHGWSNLGSDPDVYELWHSSQTQAANISGLEDETIDRLLTRGRQISDLETRTEIYQQFQERWLALAPAVMLYQPLLEQQVEPSFQILGLTPDATLSEVLYRPADRFRRLANWYQSTSRQIRSDLRNQPIPQRPR